jgi:hypothetical protein
LTKADARSRVVIRPAKITKAKPNANTRTLRPDKCLVVIVIGPSIAPRPPSQHWGQCRHHQDYLRALNHRSCSRACSRNRQGTNRNALKMKLCCGADPIRTRNAPRNRPAPRPASLRCATRDLRLIH